MCASGLEDPALFSTTTTATSCGAVNNMHDSLTPLGGMVPLMLILSSEVVFGGVGSGLYSMLAFVVIAVFSAGLMIGRIPEYLGKKIEVTEMWMSVITVLTAGVVILVLLCHSTDYPFSREFHGQPRSSRSDRNALCLCLSS